MTKLESLEKTYRQVSKKIKEAESEILLKKLEEVSNSDFIDEVSKYDICFIATILAAAKEEEKVCTINYEGYEINSKMCNFNHKGLENLMDHLSYTLAFHPSREIDSFKLFNIELLYCDQNELGDFCYENEFYVDTEILNDLVLSKLKSRVFDNLVPLTKKSIKDIDENLMELKPLLLEANSIEDMITIKKTY